MQGESEIRAIDVTQPMMLTVRIEERPTEDTVLGRNLRMIEAQLKDGSRTEYWFDPQLSLNPLHFQNYKFADLNRVSATSKSVFLKFRRHTSMYIRTDTATDIEVGPVSDSMFELPDLPIRELN